MMTDHKWFCLYAPFQKCVIQESRINDLLSETGNIEPAAGKYFPAQ